MKNKFTIGVLLHGNYPDLAHRCLSSIAATIKADDLNIRVGLNAVHPAVVRWVKRLIPEDCIWEYDTNINKYPLMRQMIYESKPVTTDYFMWFDDDSYLTGYEIGPNHPTISWLQKVEHAMIDADMIGSVYEMRYRGNQREWIINQPWYTGKPVDPVKMKFITGGWWTIRTPLLYKYNYPWPELDHNGGDLLLGALMQQQGLRMRQFRDGVKINADVHGNESKAKRRGTNQNPLGWDFEPSISDALNIATTNPNKQ